MPNPLRIAQRTDSTVGDLFRPKPAIPKPAPVKPKPATLSPEKRAAIIGTIQNAVRENGGYNGLEVSADTEAQLKAALQSGAVVAIPLKTSIPGQTATLLLEKGNLEKATSAFIQRGGCMGTTIYGPFEV